ncbi:MAG: Dabb family protein [Verrucomicrobiae bacterium]|nr:Dabb family protein [Verrucomicrobiae bacterium]MCB1237601.1 Dabb family protein [Verrucomicrobiae bacterium]MCP5538896.1 Dabb family protein [Akkermansiaceae bacterium]MCP5551999.1 Dabb family protein [Akkermansiaceae bacterium]
MVHFIALYKLQKHVDDAIIDEMTRASRSQLLRIQEVHNVRSGRRIDESMSYPFFLAIDFESLEKYRIFREDPIWVKFEHDQILPNTLMPMELLYETEPGKKIKYS